MLASCSGNRPEKRPKTWNTLGCVRGFKSLPTLQLQNGCESPPFPALGQFLHQEDVQGPGQAGPFVQLQCQQHCLCFTNLPLALCWWGLGRGCWSWACPQEQWLSGVSGVLCQVIVHDVNELTEKLFPIVEAMQKHFSAGSGTYYSDSIFFLSVAMHRIMPKGRSLLCCLQQHRLSLLHGDVNRWYLKYKANKLLGWTPRILLRSAE